MKKPLLAALVVLAASVNAWAQDGRWGRLDTEHFAIFFVVSEGAAAARFAQSAEQLRSRVTDALGVDVTAQTEVYLAPDRAAFEQLQPGRHVPKWAVGTALADEKKIVIYSPAGAWREGLQGEAAQTFVHELSHIYLPEALGHREPPRWLNEGFARMVAAEWRTNDSLRLTMALLFDEFIPLQELVSRWPSGESRAKLAYAESFSFVWFLDRRGYLRPFLTQLKNGESVAAALRHASGLNLASLEKQWRRYLRSRHTWLAVLDQGVMWAFMAALLVLGWWLVRRRRRAQYERLDDDLFPQPPPPQKLRRYRRHLRAVRDEEPWDEPRH
jgi:hypothetical protein